MPKRKAQPQYMLVYGDEQEALKANLSLEEARQCMADAAEQYPGVLVELWERRGWAKVTQTTKMDKGI